VDEIMAALARSDFWDMQTKGCWLPQSLAGGDPEAVRHYSFLLGLVIGALAQRNMVAGAHLTTADLSCPFIDPWSSVEGDANADTAERRALLVAS